MQAASESEPPVKRRRLSNDASDATAGFAPQLQQAKMEQDNDSAVNNGVEYEKEQKRRITRFVHPELPGFSGVLKQRQALLHQLHPRVSAEIKQIYRLLGE